MTEEGDIPHEAEALSELEAMRKVFEVLTPLNEASRRRVIQWVCSTLKIPLSKSRAAGERHKDHAPAQASSKKNPVLTEPLLGDAHPEEEAFAGLITKPGQRWMRRYEVTASQLEELFHYEDDSVEYLYTGSLPGESKREQAANAYLLVGVAHLLFEGEPKIPDEEARRLCRELDCYDSTNHSAYLKKMKRVFTGSKANGYTMTGPGKRDAAALVRALTQG